MTVDAVKAVFLAYEDASGGHRLLTDCVARLLPADRWLPLIHALSEHHDFEAHWWIQMSSTPSGRASCLPAARS